MAKQSLVEQIYYSYWRFRDKLSSAIHWYKHLYIKRPWYVKTTAAVVTFIVAILLYLGAVDTNFL